MLDIENRNFESIKGDLAPDMVHIWSASTEATDKDIRELLHILSEDEVQRAEKFYFKKDRDRFIVARGLLRKLLSSYCLTAPEHLCFSYNPYGKPSLLGNGMLRFNLSHSEQQILYGIAWGREVGVDIESIKPFDDAEQIVENYFSTQEKAEFSVLPDFFKKEAFYTYWTGKEAYIKAQGKGLSLPLDQFTVSFLPDMALRLIEEKHDCCPIKQWVIKDVAVTEGYKAAAVIEGKDLVFRHIQWNW